MNPITKETHITIRCDVHIGTRRDSAIQISRMLPNQRIRLNVYLNKDLTMPSARRLLRVLRQDLWKQSYELGDLTFAALYLTYRPALKLPVNQTPVERRIAEIYSYFIDECYTDDYSGTFAKWLASSMYGKELADLSATLFNVAWQQEKQS